VQLENYFCELKIYNATYIKVGKNSIIILSKNTTSVMNFRTNSQQIINK